MVKKKSQHKGQTASKGQIVGLIIFVMVLGLLLTFAWKIFMIFLGISFIDYLFFRSGKPSVHQHVRHYVAKKRGGKAVVHPDDTTKGSKVNEEVDAHFHDENNV